MTREQAKKLLPLIQAYSEGKTIQISYRDKISSDKWTDVSEPSFDTHSVNILLYRIKPEPREFWLVPFRPHSNETSYHSKEYAESVARLREISLDEIIHVREIISDD